MKFIEATFTMPMTIILVVVLIVFTVNLFKDLQNQALDHEERRVEIYKPGETLAIRAKDRIVNGLE